VNNNNINFTTLKTVPIQQISYYEEGGGAEELSSQISG
jgi:hypothetical protein